MNSPNTESGEQNEGSIRGDLAKARGRLDEIQQRLRVDERRIRTLERGNQVNGPDWQDTVDRSDAVIAAVAMFEISGSQFSGTTSLSEQSAELLERTGLTFDDVERFSAADPSSRMGAVNLLQGYLGEQFAVDLINAGAIPVPEGRVAQLADTANQPGWDLELVDTAANADPIYAQVKISDSAATIQEHFAKYPDVKLVYANSEAAAQLESVEGIEVLGSGSEIHGVDGPTVVDMGVSHDDVRAGAMALVDGNFEEPLLQQILDIPVFSLFLVAGRAASSYLKSDESGSEILRTARRGARNVMVASTAGNVATAVTAEPVIGSITASATIIGVNARRLAKANISRATVRFQSARQLLTKLSTAT